MKTPDDMIECHVDPRVLDLAARLAPVINEWADMHLNTGEIFDVFIMPHDIGSGNHRHRIIGGEGCGSGGKKLPVHRIANTQPSPEGVQ